MSRRAVAFLFLVAVGLVLALVPWTVTSERVKVALARQIREAYGLDLAVDGRATVALLPVPRVKLEGVRLSGGGGAFDATAGILRAELRLLPLLAARLRISELHISEAAFRVTLDAPERETWMADGLRRRLEAADSIGSSRLERLIVTGSSLVLSDKHGPAVELAKLGVLVRWPDPAADMDVTATADWRGEPITVTIAGLNLALLSAGQADSIEGRLTSRLGGMNAFGELTWRTGPRFVGLVGAQAPSLAALTKWTSAGLDLQDLDRAIDLGGEASAGPEGIEWPKAALRLGADRLDGSLAYRFDRARPQLRATLAGEDLDLGWILPLADPSHAEPPQADYDVRLSASTLRMGPVRLRDAAAGVLVNDQRLEVSLARATMAGGSVRGRATASLDGESRDIRGQIAMSNVDLDRLLGELGARRGFAGALSGQANFEIAGDRQPDLARQLRGRASFTVRDGELPGISLNESVRRSASAAPAEWRGGRTRFGLAALSLEFRNGAVEIAEGSLDTAATQTAVRGRLSLTDGALDLRTTTKASGTGVPASAVPLSLAMQGTISKPTVVADPAPPLPAGP